MKLQNIILAIIFVSTLSSCIKDLDTKPLNENDFTDDKAYETAESYQQGLAKIYGGFVLVGPNESSADIAVSDAGASELNRAFWSLQEISTDAGKCAWVNDSWVKEVNSNTWSATKNTAIFAAYNRIMILVAQANEYLRQTSDEKLTSRGVIDDLYSDIQKYRRETRFLRAYAYWMGLDLFGRMPFVTEESPVTNFYPPQYDNIQLFDFIETELLALSVDENLMNARTNTYPRVDKGAALSLLARLYLNAETYVGEANWTAAKETAKKVIDSGYSLADNYEALFMGDNGQNPDALKEIIFATAYDKTDTKSFGGPSYFIAAAMSGSETDEDGRDIIGSAAWGGIRSSYHYASTYFNVTNPDYSTGAFDSDDKRALFYIKGRKEEIVDESAFAEGWGVVKWSNIGFLSGVNEGSGAFSSTDLPMIRLGEIYLIYAEAALMAGSGTDALAIECLNELRKRALKTYIPISSYNADYILNERSRELFWEGHRRTDLIRFKKYSGGDYNWPWKGGVISGRSIGEGFNRFPMIIEDLIVNPNLSQNTGY